MTEQQSKLLIVGDNVRIRQPIVHSGTVLETTDSGVRVEWDDGQQGWIDHRGMVAIESDVDLVEMRNRAVRKARTCRHPSATLTYDGRDKGRSTCSAKCPDCGVAWYGPCHQWTTYRGNVKRPPRWVLLLLGGFPPDQR